jgi:hypothetical protein
MCGEIGIDCLEGIRVYLGRRPYECTRRSRSLGWLVCVLGPVPVDAIAVRFCTAVSEVAVDE